ncbi:ATP-binding protein [Streptomyces hyaluromycini]|uniref:ATP-binding protein n=2 Tax=Streptomyces TaxID=1883 RepID=UPI000B5C6118|nr:ATP-binding protein [Streptomyces hyaluromycini]
MTTSDQPASRSLAERDAETQLQLTTLEGWRDFVTDTPPPPPLLTELEHQALSKSAQVLDDENRIAYHAHTLVVATPAIRHIVTCGHRQVLMNRHERGARRGLLLSGPAGTGKSIAITQLGLSHELADRARHPGVVDRIPAIYVTVPPAATARMIAAEFARFLGLPVRARLNMTDIIEAVVGVLIDARCSLVLVDEVHNISLATRNGAEVSDTLKCFSERIPATFVYAGLDLDSKGLREGTRGAQIAGRFTLIRTAPFPQGPEWSRLVATLEDTLRLRRHRPGSLRRLDGWLHAHTGGMIGALSHAVRGAAIDAILTNTEKITKAGIEAVPLDFAAESDRRAKLARAKQP